MVLGHVASRASWQASMGHGTEECKEAREEQKEQEREHALVFGLCIPKFSQDSIGSTLLANDLCPRLD